MKLMKFKLWMLYILIAVPILTACSAGQEAVSTSTQLGTVESSTIATTKVVIHQGSQMTFPSLASLVNSSDIIVVGEVVSSSINRIDLVSEGYVDAKSEIFTHVSSFYIDVLETMKGAAPDNMKLKVDLRCGGEIDGYVEIFDPAIPSPIVGKKYIVFLNKPHKYSGREYFEFMFVGSTDSFIEIENGKIVPPQDKHSVVRETTYDSLIHEIEKIITPSE